MAIPGTARAGTRGPETPDAMSVRPPYTPRPRPQQAWVHSCCSASKLERALSDPDVSAIEADIMMGGGSGTNGGTNGHRIPVMAHPTWRRQLPTDVDLTFSEFLERCLADGSRHLKLDFKEAEAVEPCLELLAQRWPQLHSNGQAIWLNADVLPGPNSRGPCRVPATTFLPLCRRLCPHAVLSLGWTVAPLGPEEAYGEDDIAGMHRLCQEYNVPGSSVVFAASLRFSERCVALFGQLLTNVPDSQLLLWTGTGELPVHPSTHTKFSTAMSNLGYGERVGFDVQLASSCCQVSVSRAVDCTFFWSRWSRWLCGCASPAMVGSLGGSPALGERQPLVRETHSGMRTPNLTPSAKSFAPPTPQRIQNLSAGEVEAV